MQIRQNSEIFSAPLFWNNWLQAKSTWSLSNNERLDKKRCALAKGNIHRPRSANQSPASPVPKQWEKCIFNPKNKVWLELFSSACFI